MNPNFLPEFVRKLFCSADELDVLCHTCHDVKTKQEREERKNGNV